MPMAKVTNHRCRRGLMKKLPAPGFMQATTWVFEMDLTCVRNCHETAAAPSRDVETLS